MIDNQTIRQVDAFADEPFMGNPAGVMIVDKDTKSEWVQNMAMEMNLSETAFVIPYEGTISTPFEVWAYNLPQRKKSFSR